MREKRVGFKYKNKNFHINTRECNFFERAVGLMFKSRNSEALLFEFNKNVGLSIHSIFVFFPFFVLWLDDKDRVIEVRKVNPFTLSVSSKKPFRKIVEIPVNKKYSRLINVLRR
ncbi:MAG: DUF192 domain-containing protein [Nanoarchaeota archaeon]